MLFLPQNGERKRHGADRPPDTGGADRRHLVHLLRGDTGAEASLLQEERHHGTGMPIKLTQKV